MKISKVDVMLTDLKSSDNPGWRPVVLRIYTDEGIYGDGEAAMAFGCGSEAAFGMIKDLAGLVIGMDPLENEVIWEKLYRESFWAQNAGPVVFSGISAIDIALWDIKGKYYKEPVFKLLGGRMREKLKCYASQLQFGWDERKIPALSDRDYAKNAMKAVDEGYRAIKIDFNTYAPDGHIYSYDETSGFQDPMHIKTVVGRLKAVREAVGPDIDIIMENHAATDVQSAVNLGRIAEEYDILFIEEPVSPDPKMNKLVADRINIPLAQGERIYTRKGFAPYFENGSVRLIQPDIGNSGGITEVKKICDMAQVYNVGVQIHVCGSPLLTTASLQLEAAIGNFAIHEHHVFNRYRSNKALCICDYQPENGYFSIPELPGLGNELSDFCFNHSIKVTVDHR